MCCVCTECNLFNRKWLPEATDLNQALGKPHSATLPIGLQKSVVFFIYPFLLHKSSEDP